MKLRLFLLTLATVVAAGVITSAQNDLNQFMQEVLSRRDDNWKRLQQYILDERETVELRGPTRVALFGERRDFTWFVRDGFFVRSPVKVNGATVGDDDRKKYEDDFLLRQRKRELSGRGRGDSGPALDAPDSDDTPRDVDGLIRQTRQPQFISSAYFLRFKFDEGRYALVGREQLEGRDVLRVEYYPTKLFSSSENRVGGGRGNGRQQSRRVTPPKAQEAEMMRLMNKTSKVTLWIEPVSHQIVKYDFDELGWDFFPSQWLIRVSDARASMTMGQMFPEVWLPRTLQMQIDLQLAVGPVKFEYSLDYHDYRQADVSATILVPDPR